ncbi:MAG TPA: STAS domain-containing protein [Candidatus Eisenbacteria bacterium]|nr:STAS domain-containing protein [Candidatus Eisenbacteria bacterium]
MEERVGEIVILRPPMPFWLGAEETDEFTGRVRDLAAAGCTRLVVNLASIPRMNSISVGALGEAWNALRPNQGRLIVCCAGKECLLILKLTRLDEVITVCASEAEALALLAPSQAP